MFLFGIIFISVFSGFAEGQMVAFVSFAVSYSFVTQSNGRTDLTITAAFKPHEISKTISGTNLWRLGFFGSQNMQGTGLRANQVYQMLSDSQASLTARPGQNLTFVASSRVNLNGIGPDQDFPYYCYEFAKNENATPDFTFQVGNNQRPAVFCQSSQNLPRPSQHETRPSALIASVYTNFQITKSFDDNLPSRANITITLEPHPQTDTITGSNLWRLGFFGSRNKEGSGERKNESPQILLPVQANHPLRPNTVFVISVERFLNLRDIGRDEPFPYLCVEFGKQPAAIPDFIFLGTEDEKTIILCQTLVQPEEITDLQPAILPANLVEDVTEGRIVEMLSTSVITNEGSRGTTILVAVNFRSSEDLTIGFSTVDSDYITVGEAVVPAGHLVGTAEVTVVNNEIAVPSGRTDVTVRIDPSEYYTIGPKSTVTITILDDDTVQPDPLLIEFTTTDLKVQEDGGDVTINLSLNTINDQDELTINFRIRETNPSSARGGEDFQEETVTETVPVGVRFASVTARLIDDDERERVEMFVIEIDESTLPANVQVVGQNFITVHIEDSDGCPNEYLEVEDMCFRKVEELLNFDDAREACHQDGAELASASTPHKNTIVSGIADGQRCWVGAYVIGEEYTWINGDTWEFTNWRKREPNWHKKPRRACIETNFVRATLWNDHFCKAKRPSVCEKPVLPEPES